MDKVKLTQLQADAIKVVISNTFHSKPEDVVRIHARDCKNWSNDVKALHDVPLDTLIRALYIGYEVEQTPEDKVRELVVFWRHGDEKGNVYDGPTIAGEICRVLKILNIKIKGVNDHE